MKKLLVPLDGSAESESALDYAKVLATHHSDIRLELLGCLETRGVHTLSGLEGLAEEVVADVQREDSLEAYLQGKGSEMSLACDTHVEVGEVADRILERAAGVDMVLMARRGGWRGHSVLGSVTTQVARASARPVLVVPGQMDSPAKLDRILVCLDGSELAERGLVEAAELARLSGGRLILYRFVPLLAQIDPEAALKEAKSYLQKQRERYPKLVSETVALPGPLGNHISEVATELDIDLVVVATHGRQGISRWVLGSVAEHLLRHLGKPILVVH